MASWHHGQLAGLAPLIPAPEHMLKMNPWYAASPYAARIACSLRLQDGCCPCHGGPTPLPSTQQHGQQFMHLSPTPYSSYQMHSPKPGSNDMSTSKALSTARSQLQNTPPAYSPYFLPFIDSAQYGGQLASASAPANSSAQSCCVKTDPYSRLKLDHGFSIYPAAPMPPFTHPANPCDDCTGRYTTTIPSFYSAVAKTELTSRQQLQKQQKGESSSHGSNSQGHHHGTGSSSQEQPIDYSVRTASRKHKHSGGNGVGHTGSDLAAATSASAATSVSMESASSSGGDSSLRQATASTSAVSHHSNSGSKSESSAAKKRNGLINCPSRSDDKRSRRDLSGVDNSSSNGGSTGSARGKEYDESYLTAAAVTPTSSASARFHSRKERSVDSGEIPDGGGNKQRDASSAASKKPVQGRDDRSRQNDKCDVFASHRLTDNTAAKVAIINPVQQQNKKQHNLSKKPDVHRRIHGDTKPNDTSNPSKGFEVKHELSSPTAVVSRSMDAAHAKGLQKHSKSILAPSSRERAGCLEHGDDVRGPDDRRDGSPGCRNGVKKTESVPLTRGPVRPEEARAFRAENEAILAVTACRGEIASPTRSETVIGDKATADVADKAFIRDRVVNEPRPSARESLSVNQVSNNDAVQASSKFAQNARLNKTSDKNQPGESGQKRQSSATEDKDLQDSVKLEKRNPILNSPMFAQSTAKTSQVLFMSELIADDSSKTSSQITHLHPMQAFPPHTAYPWPFIKFHPHYGEFLQRPFPFAPEVSPHMATIDPRGRAPLIFNNPDLSNVDGDSRLVNESGNASGLQWRKAFFQAPKQVSSCQVASSPSKRHVPPITIKTEAPPSLDGEGANDFEGALNSWAVKRQMMTSKLNKAQNELNDITPAENIKKEVDIYPSSIDASKPTDTDNGLKVSKDKRCVVDVDNAGPASKKRKSDNDRKEKRRSRKIRRGSADVSVETNDRQSHHRSKKNDDEPSARATHAIDAKPHKYQRKSSEHRQRGRSYSKRRQNRPHAVALTGCGGGGDGDCSTAGRIKSTSKRPHRSAAAGKTSNFYNEDADLDYYEYESSDVENETPIGAADRKKFRTSRSQIGSSYVATDDRGHSPHPSKRRSQTSQLDIKRLIVRKSCGETILHKSARLNYEDVLLKCLESGRYDVNVRDNTGYSPLHEASVRGNIRIAKHLILYGADVNASSYDGTRPIHDAVENGHIEVVRLLLSCGADPTLATYSGRTPCQIANRNELTDMILLIKGYLLDTNGHTDLLESDRNAWQFKWTADDSVEETGYDVLGCPPSPDQDTNDQTLIFEFKSQEPVTSYKLNLNSRRPGDGSVCENFVLLPDVLAALGPDMTRDRLMELRPSLVIHKISFSDFLVKIQHSQIAKAVSSIPTADADAGQLGSDVELVAENDVSDVLGEKYGDDEAADFISVQEEEVH